MARRIVPVILCGGAGTRLWPLSNADRPKQFARIEGERTLRQQTALRPSDPDRFAPPSVVARDRHGEAVEEQLRDVGIAPGLLILEPEGRNTGPATGLAALAAEPDDILLVMPSDHLIRDTPAFLRAIDAGMPLAGDGMLVTFGIPAQRPETGYGYIERGQPIGEDAFRVTQFVEKPDRARAETMLAEGRHDWNGGIFLFRADAWLDALDALQPGLLSAVRAALAAQHGDDLRIWPDARSFARVPALSIDHAVMETWPNLAVVPVEMGWSDIGSWDTLHRLGDTDAAGNVLTGDAAAIDSRGCLIRSDGPTVVTIGVDDLIVIATGQAVLVVPRDQAQRAGEAVEALRQRDPRQP